MSSKKWSGRIGILVQAALYASFSVVPALATWSIVIVDTRTKEVAVGAATCLTGFDLAENLPVIVPEIGAGCAQALVDTNAFNRFKIYYGLLDGLWPSDILVQLQMNDSQYQKRQYGIVDTDGHALTFTGSMTNAYAGGVVGTSGDLVYAIQGNILTGAAVITATEQAILQTPGDIPTKLMAAMQAARAMGGDGRCSCSTNNPTSCGSPPPSFDKSAHVGFIMDSRAGDTDGGCTTGGGCAIGDYFMDLNVAFQTTEDPDPVVQLQTAFDAFRAGLIGKADAIQSQVLVDPPHFLANGSGEATLQITLRDWQGLPLPLQDLTVGVAHSSDSAQTTTIGSVVQNQSNTFQVTLTGSDVVGIDRFSVTVDQGGLPVVLMPYPRLLSLNRHDLERDGDVDVFDYEVLQICMSGPMPALAGDCGYADFEGDGDTDLGDFARLQNAFTSGLCKELHLDSAPVATNVACGDPLTLSVTVTADPGANYQWLLEGNPIDGATSATYFVPAAGFEHYGQYSVEAANTCGLITTPDVLVRIFGTCP